MLVSSRILRLKQISSDSSLVLASVFSLNRSNGPTIAQRGKELDEHVDSVDAAIDEVHPEYSVPVLSRIGFMKEHARSHINKAASILSMTTVSVSAIFE